MLLKLDTYLAQSNLAAYCRTGNLPKIPGVVNRRLPHYRRLVFNVVKDALETTYPIAYKYIEKDIWERICHDFFSNHGCSHPQVWRMPKEFYEYCCAKDLANKFDLPYLNDLLHFEWLEAEMYMMEDLPYPNFEKETNWLHSKIALNPEYRIIKLQYPVHIKTPDIAKNEKGDYFLLLYREKESGKIQFVSMSPLFTFLLESIIDGEKTLEQIFTDILYIFGINDLALLQKEGTRFLEDLYQRGFVLGVRN